MTSTLLRKVSNTIQIKWAGLKWGDMSNAILPRGHFKTSFADFAKVAFFDLYPPVVNQDYEDAKDLIRECVYGDRWHQALRNKRTSRREHHRFGRSHRPRKIS